MEGYYILIKWNPSRWYCNSKHLCTNPMKEAQKKLRSHAVCDSTLVSSAESSSRQKSIRDKLELHNTIKMDLTDIHTAFQWNRKEYHRTFSKTDHILWQKASLNRNKKIKITLLKLNSVLNEKWAKTEIKKEI